MKLTFDQTAKDFAAFSYYHYHKNGRRKIIQYLASIVFLAALALVGYNVVKRGSMDGVNITTVSLMLVVNIYYWVILSKWAFIKRTEQFIKKKGNERYAGPREMEFDEQQISVKSPLSDYKTSWQSVISLNETKEHLFLYVSTSQALIIPKRIFLLDHELFDVKEFIERKIQVTE